MRYVFGNRSLLAGLLLALAGCMGQMPVERSQPNFLVLNEDGCRQDLIDEAHLYFGSAVVYVTSARLENGSTIRFANPTAVDLLNPNTVAEIIELLPAG